MTQLDVNVYTKKYRNYEDIRIFIKSTYNELYGFNQLGYRNDTIGEDLKKAMVKEYSKYI